MKVFSNRAISILNNLSHSIDLDVDGMEFAHIIWHYRLESVANKGSVFKILTLSYSQNRSKFNQIELLILEAFSFLVVSRTLEQVFVLSFKELESFLRDFNNCPSIPSEFMEQANSVFEATKLDFLNFLLLNEYLQKGFSLETMTDWTKLPLSDKANIINEALKFSHNYYGNLMPTRLVSVTSAEVVLTDPRNHLSFSDQVFRRFLKSIGVEADLKLVAV